MVDARKPAAGASAARTPDPAVADATSAMVPRFNVFFRWFAKRFFPYFDLDDAMVRRLRELEARGSVVYVMRYASRLDYFLFNTLFLREGLRLSAFANGIFFYYRPVLEAVRCWLRARRTGGTHLDHDKTRSFARELARDGASQFLFLRT